jgi:uncharacterized protein (UPF0276 family)
MSASVGVGYRRALHENIIEHSDEIDSIEVISEHFFDESSEDLLNLLKENFTVVPHGLSLSICSTEIDWCFVHKIKNLIRKTNAHYYSDHLALTSVPGISFEVLTPMIPTQEQLLTVIDNTIRVQDILEVPLVLENITHLINFPEQIPLYEFWNELTDKTDCGILLDVTNLYTNSFNFNFDPYEEIMKWPLDAIRHIHLAGGMTYGGEKMDGHNAPIEQETWKIFEFIYKKLPNIENVIIERDANFGNFHSLLNELSVIKNISKGTRYVRA